MRFKEIIEHKDVVPYIISRNLLEQYKKAKSYLLDGLFDKVDFKIRKPKNDKVYQFRINQKYRAYCFIEGDILKIFKISDHQD
ncbi:MAG: hypothetical protein PHG82_04305 [Candidatus Gracilibacteria bacterium]|nr:hypothetical protein [Candidatus Gracilibacteria bacterium]